MKNNRTYTKYGDLASSDLNHPFVEPEYTYLYGAEPEITYTPDELKQCARKGVIPERFVELIPAEEQKDHYCFHGECDAIEALYPVYSFSLKRDLNIRMIKRYLRYICSDEQENFLRFHQGDLVSLIGRKAWRRLLNKYKWRP